VSRVLIVLLVVSVLVGSATAAWQAGASGAAASAARTMPAGAVPNQPTAAGANVTVTWSASAFAGGGNVPAYVVRRFNALTSTEGTVLTACSGLVAGTTCTENNVPTGSWKYTVTPAAGNWRGTQSGQSASVLVL
jgi:hypothetical protein